MNRNNRLGLGRLKFPSFRTGHPDREGRWLECGMTAAGESVDPPVGLKPGCFADDGQGDFRSGALTQEICQGLAHDAEFAALHALFNDEEPKLTHPYTRC